jgi:tRNA(fMet)-specific endonuclease VapC
VILLDTNHLTVLRYPEHSCYETLVKRMDGSADQRFAVPVVALEEQLRGWLAVIHHATDTRRQVEAYSRLAGLFEFFADWEIFGFETAATEVFEQLRR